MLTTKEVSKFLNIHINTVRRWADSGLLRCYRVGPRQDRRFSKEDIIEYLNKTKEVACRKEGN